MTTKYAINGIDTDRLFIRRSAFDAAAVANILAHEIISGALYTWGRDWVGQLGDGLHVSHSAPAQVFGGGNDWHYVGCGYSSAAIKTDGTLWMWGKDTYGTLADGMHINRSVPGQVFGGGSIWKQVAMGRDHMAAVKTDGTLWVCGYNSWGQLGDGTFVDKSYLTQIGTGTDWSSVACGYSHTAAIKTDGTLWLWGKDSYGQLGIGSTAYRNSPVQSAAGGNTWKQIACGYGQTAAIKNDGSLWVCGYNYYGELGDGTTVNKSTFVQTSLGGNDWKQVACSYHLAAVKTDGTLYTWGDGLNGQLGNGSTATSRSVPAQTVVGGTDWKQVSVGKFHTAAIKVDGTLWAWGDNVDGEVGDGTNIRCSSPVQTSLGGNTWKQVSCGGFHTAAIKA